MGGTLSSSSSWQATGRNVLITGASSGIGAELAKQFAKEGANLALLARGKAALEQVKQECLTLGAPTVHIFLCDLTNNQDMARACQEVKQVFSTSQNKMLDVVVLNAGRSQGCYFEEIQDPSQIDYMLKLNVNSVMIFLHHLLPHHVRKSKDSRIVVISSISGLMGVPYRTIYCASKHALTGFCNALRIELLDTYGNNNRSSSSNDGPPAVCLINFPEVAGTNLNAGRMDFGAQRKPAQFDTTNVTTVQEACAALMEEAIRPGKRQWGEPLKVSTLVTLYSFFPTILDRLILKTVQKTHYRPDDNDNGNDNNDHDETESEKVPLIRSGSTDNRKTK